MNRNRKSKQYDQRSKDEQAGFMAADLDYKEVMPEKLIIEQDGVPRGYQMCRCVKCKEVQQCTPSNDFYTMPDKDGLFCERCFRSEANIGKLYHLK